MLVYYCQKLFGNGFINFVYKNYTLVLRKTIDSSIDYWPNVFLLCSKIKLYSFVPSSFHQGQLLYLTVRVIQLRLIYFIVNRSAYVLSF